MTTLYGIRNCDTVKKARRWLDAHGVDYRFHDFRADGLEAKKLDAWIKAVGWEALLNRRGTTWRRLPEGVRDGIDEKHAAALMLEQPTLIRRPVVEHGKQVLVGFDAQALTQCFK
ncbi:ArsC family reductase [Thioalkalivibrio thiocyanodenitrificans]|uniref:ArsC family reductase n=1 Tax=Thioalkalivibrio thiocyanodenitrificans TaxID=243063 RepID=UPI00037D91D8|nr:ArsC family reductase [Thioalkalivibrio thiocyanodenitrificans]